MCEWGTDAFIYVIRRNHPDIPDGWHLMAVDACIADYVQRMNDLGIITMGCCCGHGKTEPQVSVAWESGERARQLGYGLRVYREGESYEHIMEDVESAGE